MSPIICSYSLLCTKLLQNTGADDIVKAPTPVPVIPRSLASASSIAWLMHQKFELSIPFYRQEKEWENYRIVLSRATMANWGITASNL